MKMKGIIKVETPKAFLISFEGGKEVWVAKSVITLKNNKMTVPDWLSKKAQIPKSFYVKRKTKTKPKPQKKPKKNKNHSQKPKYTAENQHSALKGANKEPVVVELYGEFLTWFDVGEEWRLKKIDKTQRLPFKLNDGRIVYLKLDRIHGVFKSKTAFLYKVLYETTNPDYYKTEPIEAKFPILVSSLIFGCYDADEPSAELKVNFKEKRIEYFYNYLEGD